MNYFSGMVKAEYILRWTSMMGEMNESQSRQDFLQYNSSKCDYYSFYQDRVAVTFKGNDFELQKILRIFISIDLSSNAFQGEIPNKLGSLNPLTVLNLSHTSLSENIPLSFGNLSQLVMPWEAIYH